MPDCRRHCERLRAEHEPRLAGWLAFPGERIQLDMLDRLQRHKDAAPAEMEQPLTCSA